MTSDSVSNFLDLARANQLLLPDIVDDLFRQPDAPQQNLSSLCDFLLNRKVITPYQANLIRTGRGYELNFAGYPIIDEVGPCPGGTIYKALHPSLRTPVLIRRLRPEWFAPADNVAAYVTRAQAASPITHKYLANVLDAGAYREEPFVAMDPFDGADLETLVRDIGPMPAPLAAEYARQAAQALQAAHDRGVSHGHVSPASLFVGPLSPMSKQRPDGTPRMRPSSTAKVKIFDLGLVPVRPPVNDAVIDRSAPVDPSLGLAYLPPERLTQPTYDGSGPAADVYGLGCTLFFLLTGKPVVDASNVGDLLKKIADGPRPPLEVLRPDAPAALATVVRGMLAKEAGARPTAGSVADLLSALASPPGGKPSSAPPPEAGPPTGIPVELTLDSEAAPVDMTAAPANGMYYAQPVDGAAPGAYPYAAWPAADGGSHPPDSNYGWGSESAPAAGYDPTASASSPSLPRVVEDDPNRKKKLYMWLGVGLGLQILAVMGWIYLAMGPSTDDDAPKRPRVTKPRTVKQP